MSNILLGKSREKNSSRKNEEAEPRQKQPPLEDVSGGESNLML